MAGKAIIYLYFSGNPKRSKEIIRCRGLSPQPMNFSQDDLWSLLQERGRIISDEDDLLSSTIGNPEMNVSLFKGVRKALKSSKRGRNQTYAILFITCWRELCMLRRRYSTAKSWGVGMKLAWNDFKGKCEIICTFDLKISWNNWIRAIDEIFEEKLYCIWY